MPFHPLPLSVRIGGYYTNIESTFVKVIITPFYMVFGTIIFALEILTFTIRYLIHEIRHIYSDRDESEWVYR
jgi:hypothetical protein